MPETKQKFVFTSRATGAIPVEARVANSLEFIAHYLDRIEGHLERLANAVESEGANQKVRTQLQRIEQALLAKR